MIQSGTSTEFQCRRDGTLSFRGRLCVPQDEDLKKEILDEVHSSEFEFLWIDNHVDAMPPSSTC